MNFQLEKEIAVIAVRRASYLTEKVFNQLIKEKSAAGAHSKEDKSPVTIGDFGAQAVVIALLKDAFPKDPIVGEEDADYLRSNKDTCSRVWSLVQESIQQSKERQELGQIKDAEQMLSIIDQGNYTGGREGRMWTLDPIDGTKGFLRGAQYAICLSLIENGKPMVSAISCPNLPFDFKQPETSHKGVIMSAIRGQGSFQYALHDLTAKPTQVHMKDVQDPKESKFCEGVEAGHSMQGTQEEIAKKLGIVYGPTKMDSQAKYVSLARGDGDIYLRLPTSMAFEEKIWDHAGGSLLVEEAGGVVSDMFGKPLDFGVGRTLKNNNGVIAAYKGIFKNVIDATAAITSQDPHFKKN
ncbi:3',5'-bisphosphate nucleotidase/inositol-1,4- bisphosphate 1-phosphatase [Schizosaccharomyces octosporus yFS286]|uniref:3'(2'),5'-bisphosphate nucleotidase n=1 Tax=Schizosaccharomyces octosporus (strain yFS286) TaxID=483514 RepID=S9RI53_SCHOY|nr:3',5'-bisphosphate nucleotidase/inositol-1,4- bisphosphate 1-phosphatase [Schizosaccharomyces octosporus yFS286]EPX73684.1 3',5'-bisphosphate nucleotidase/inositol-1,4- bisphosphate 1-phosphatase [Schizosaccharomyces octosporus yFS286]